MGLALDTAPAQASGNGDARAAMADCERRWAALIDELPGMVFRCVPDARWSFERVSRGAAAVLGATADRLVGPGQPGWADFVHPDDIDTATAAVSEALATDTPYRIRYRVVGLDGRERQVRECGWGVREDHGELIAREGFAWEAAAAGS